MTSNRILVIDEDDVLSKAVHRALEWIDGTEEIVWLRPAEDVLAMAKAERFATILLGASGDALKLLGALTSEAMGEPPVFLIADQVSEAMAGMPWIGVLSTAYRVSASWSAACPRWSSWRSSRPGCNTRSNRRLGTQSSLILPRSSETAVC